MSLGPTEDAEDLKPQGSRPAPEARPQGGDSIPSSGSRLTIAAGALGILAPALNFGVAIAAHDSFGTRGSNSSSRIIFGALGYSSSLIWIAGLGIGLLALLLAALGFRQCGWSRGKRTPLLMIGVIGGGATVLVFIGLLLAPVLASWVLDVVNQIGGNIQS